VGDDAGPVEADADEGAAGGRAEGGRDVPDADGREGGAAPRVHPKARPGGQGDRLPRGVSGHGRTRPGTGGPMPPLQGPVLLALYQSAVGNWRVTGYIEWKEMARAWVRDNLGGLSLKDVGELMYRHVAAGGEIDQVPERRPEWNDRDFHYDLRIAIE